MIVFLTKFVFFQRTNPYGHQPVLYSLVLWWPLMVWRRTTFEGILGVQRFLSFKRFVSVLELEKHAKVCFLSWFEWHSTLHLVSETDVFAGITWYPYVFICIREIPVIHPWQHSASGAASSNQVPQQAEVVGQPSTMVKVWLEPGLDLLHSHWHVPVCTFEILIDFGCVSYSRQYVTIV